MVLSASRKRAAPMALPERVAWLEHLTLDMTTSANQRMSLSKRNRVLYELQLSYTPLGQKQPTTWTLARTFDEYRSLQRRLVKTLKPGHKCNAECRWLHNVVKHHFPKNSFFCKSCPTTVENTRLALLRVLTTVRASLVNRGNLGCGTFRDDVSKEFAAFLVGTAKDSALLTQSSSATASDSASANGEPQDLTASFASFTSDEENQVLGFEFDDLSSEFARRDCGLCNSSLDCEEPVPASAYCTTATFSCGHQFHDACVLPVLGEVVRCPLCQHEESRY